MKRRKRQLHIFPEANLESTLNKIELSQQPTWLGSCLAPKFQPHGHWSTPHWSFPRYSTGTFNSKRHLDYVSTSDGIVSRNKPFSTASDGGNGAVQRGMPKQTVATWHCQMLFTNITVISASFRSLCARIRRKTQSNRHGQSILPIPMNKHTPWISSLAKGSAMADTAQPTESGSDKLF